MLHNLHSPAQVTNMGWMTDENGSAIFETDYMDLSNFSEFTVEVEAFIYNLPLDLQIYLNGMPSWKSSYSKLESFNFKE